VGGNPARPICPRFKSEEDLEFHRMSIAAKRRLAGLRKQKRTR
ncbi:MAG: hypothetical protein JWO82_4401, partial [Akkermansiaceae bacterium]|nr:hypothetical protein [Akkermansiaceae bacterium]